MFELDRRGDVAILRLAHGKAHALDLELAEGLTRAFAALPSGGARALVLTGTGSIFSAGVDLVRLVEGGAAYVRRFYPVMEGCFRTLWTLPIPTVAAINGHAIAGGGVFAWACDWRVMAEGPGLLGVPELQVGVPFPGLGIEIVRAAVPVAALGEVVLRGRNFTAAEAKARGLVDELVHADACVDRACAAATALITTPPAAYAFAKRTLRQPALDALERAAVREREIAAAWEAPETLAAVRAYVERTLKKR